jgi:hypothetical protein
MLCPGRNGFGLLWEAKGRAKQKITDSYVKLHVKRRLRNWDN